MVENSFGVCVFVQSVKQNQFIQFLEQPRDLEIVLLFLRVRTVMIFRAAAVLIMIFAFDFSFTDKKA